MKMINKCSHSFFMLTNGTCYVLLNNNNESEEYIDRLIVLYYRSVDRPCFKLEKN